MFTIAVEARFHATHHVRFPDGGTEEPHAHEWVVKAYVARVSLNAVGMVEDFGQVQEALRSVLSPLENADLNASPALGGRNPTAEVLAEHLYHALTRQRMTPPSRVEVTEAPGCCAIFEPDR